MPRARRRSSGLGADIRGDTGAPAVSTLNTRASIGSPPLTPRPSQSRISRPPSSKRRKARTLLHRWQDLSFRHTWANPLLLTLCLVLGYALHPTPSNPLHRAIFLSYPLPPTHPLIPAHARHRAAPTHYGKGPRDFAFVAFYCVVLSFTREFLMQRLIRPLAIHYGIRSRAKQARFMEQAYTALYFLAFGPYGLYVMGRTPVWYFDTTGMFDGFPHRTHEGVFKAYYLLQASYWAQQAIVLMLQLEKPRKDFRELVGHHVVTLALIGLSYRFHFTYMGLAVYITHDISDFFLATSKCLNYVDSPIVVPYFTLFIGIWVYLRHYINLCILHATLTKFATVGPYILDWETQQYKCWISQIVTFVLLASLQSINLFWFFLIVRISYNIVFRSHVKDVRSDYEDEDAVEDAHGEGVGAGKGHEGREGEKGGVGRGNGMVGAGAGGLGLGGGNADAEGEASVEQLDEYVDIEHEEKKDR